MAGSRESRHCDRDGSELEKETFSLHDKLSTQVSLSSFHSPGPDKEGSSDFLRLPLKNLKQVDGTQRRLEKNYFPFFHSNSEVYADSSYDSSVSEESSIVSSPCMSLAAYSDTQSEDLDRTDIWVSSLHLDDEDFALLPDCDKEQFLDIFGFDFPSPSFRAMRSLQLQLGASSSPGPSQRKEPSESDDPIFWPFERTSYNSPEFDKFMSVSPRRNTSGIKCSEVRQSNPVQRLLNNKLHSAMKSTERQRGSIHLASKGTMVCQDKVKSATVPSRLSTPAKASAASHHQPARNCERKRPPHIEIGCSNKVSSSKLQAEKPLQQTKVGNIRHLMEKECAIEELIGLDEFDGHEGISSDSTDYQFNLWLSPR